LATEDYMNFDNYSSLLENCNNIDISVMAAIEMHFRIEKKNLSKDQLRSNKFIILEKRRKKLHNKVGIQKDTVNSTINELSLKSSFETKLIEEEE
ncbi:MAG: hypothetical protein WAU01_09960, partial [Saprospiraceae bacterium]